MIEWLKFWNWNWFIKDCGLCNEPIFFKKSGILKVNTSEGVIDKPLCRTCVNVLMANPRPGFTPPK